MNRKKFWADYAALKEWLENQGVDSSLVLLKLIALVIGGQTEQEAILGKAITPGQISDVFQEQQRYHHTLDMPPAIERLLGYWVHALPRETSFMGEVYEKVSSNRRVSGVYYTPQPVIDFILHHTLETCNVVEYPFIKILDPACGCGYFLLRAYDILFKNYVKSQEMLQEKYPHMDWSDRGIHNHILSHNLWGADIDPQAVDITLVSLLLKQKNFDIKPNIIAYDSLKRPERSLASEATLKFWSSRYDYVIGNPPYLSFGLRGRGNLDDDYKHYLRQNYSDCAEYKLSYYVLFMQRGIEMLSSGGKLGYIVPDSFLLGRYYSKIRRYIMGNTNINAIAHLSTSVFKSAATGYSTICILTKKDPAQAEQDQQINIYQISTLDDLRETVPVCKYEQGYFSQLPHNRFRIFFEKKMKDIIEYIDSIGAPLKAFATGHTGIRSISKQEDIVADSKSAQGNWQPGLVSGSQITRYNLQYKGHWLNIDPDLIYKGGWRPEIIGQRKILLRQTGDSIIASVDEQHYYHLNNIHSFVIKQGSSVMLDYLLLLLNSRLLSFYYHVTSMEYGRSMAQTDIETLELLPVVINDTVNLQAAELVKTMSSLVGRRVAGDYSAARKIEALDDYLNQLVYKIYALQDSQIHYIENYEKKLRRKQY